MDDNRFPNGYGQNNNYGQFNGSYGQNNGNYGQFGGYGQNSGFEKDNKDADNGFGIASMILGIISILLFCSCVNWITGIIAIIFAVIQLARGGQKAYPIVGIITSAFSFLLCIFVYLFVGLMVMEDPSYRSYSYPYYYNAYDSYNYYDSYNSDGNYDYYDNYNSDGNYDYYDGAVALTIKKS